MTSWEHVIIRNSYRALDRLLHTVERSHLDLETVLCTARNGAQSS
jgi:hypothetical protein